MADIFVSYSRQDLERVAPLVAALESEGWSVWWDSEITAGEEFDTLISRELDSASAVIVVWTENSVESRWVKGEARDAADRGILAPVRFGNARLPIDFRAVHTTDMDDWEEDRQCPSFRALCKAVEPKLKVNTKLPGRGAAEKGKRSTINICVLPFSNMSGDPEQDYFSDGVTEDIITDLSKVSALSVVSRNTAFSFKGKTVDVPQVGRQTKATHVLEGSVRKSGNRVRITAQLIDAANDAHIWAERYDRDLDDIFALQDEISEAVVAALKLKLLPEEKKALEQRSTNNPEAYKLYLMARQFSVMGNERHQEIVVRICKRAVELDPNYARAWATMAIAQWDMHRRSASDEDGTSAAERAIALDPNLADAHAALGAAHQGQGQYQEGLKACENALRLDPNSYEGNRIAGLCCMPQGRYEDAVRYFETAAAAINTEFVAASFAAQAYEDMGDISGGKAASKRALARIEKIIAAEPDHGRALGYGAGLLAQLGEAERAKEWIMRGRLLDPDNTILHFNFVCALARLRETDAALELLDNVIDKASMGWLIWLEKDTDLDPIRNDPRFAQIVTKAKERFTVASA